MELQGGELGLEKHTKKLNLHFHLILFVLLVPFLFPSKMISCNSRELVIIKKFEMIQLFSIRMTQPVSFDYKGYFLSNPYSRNRQGSDTHCLWFSLILLIRMELDQERVQKNFQLFGYLLASNQFVGCVPKYCINLKSHRTTFNIIQPVQFGTICFLLIYYKVAPSKPVSSRSHLFQTVINLKLKSTHYNVDILSS